MPLDISCILHTCLMCFKVLIIYIVPQLLLLIFISKFENNKYLFGTLACLLGILLGIILKIPCYIIVSVFFIHFITVFDLCEKLIDLWYGIK